MTLAEELRDCADAVASASSTLVEGAPVAVDRCAATLQVAVRRLEALRSGLSGGAEALAQAWRLRHNLRMARTLLENAAAYHRGWSDRVAVQTAGYGPGGAPGAISHAGRIWTEA